MRNSIFVLSILVACFACISCEREEGLKMKANPDAQDILTPSEGSVLTLTKENAGNPVSFTWNDPDYGFQASVTYIVQLDMAGNSFNAPVVVGSVNNSSELVVNQGSLNSKLIDKGLEPEVERSMEMRVASIINSHIDTLYSPVTTIKVVPYSTIIIIPPIYLLGDGSQAGWNNNTNIELRFSEAEDAFITYDSLNPGGYIKFIGERGFWAPQWGTDGTGTAVSGPLVYRPTESVPDPAAIPAPANPGMYKIMADTAALIYDVSPYNIGAVGSATANGWDAPDTKMSYDHVNDIWTLTTDLVAGEIKFRLNDAWDWNLGGDINDLTQGGDNIAVAEAGNYTITLNLSKAPFKAVFTKN